MVRPWSRSVHKKIQRSEKAKESEREVSRRRRLHGVIRGTRGARIGSQR